jgi:hypothetical protein
LSSAMLNFFIKAHVNSDERGSGTGSRQERRGC